MGEHVDPVATVEHPQPHGVGHRGRPDLGAGVVGAQDLAVRAPEPRGTLRAVLAHAQAVAPAAATEHDVAGRRGDRERGAAGGRAVGGAAAGSARRRATRPTARASVSPRATSRWRGRRMEGDLEGAGGTDGTNRAERPGSRLPAMRLLFFGTYDARRTPAWRVLREGLREHGSDGPRVQRPPRPVHRRPGRDAAPAVAAAAPAFRLARCWVRLSPVAALRGGRQLAGRRAGRLPRATSTCCWPGCCSGGPRRARPPDLRRRHRRRPRLSSALRMRLLRALDRRARQRRPGPARHRRARRALPEQPADRGAGGAGRCAGRLVTPGGGRPAHRPGALRVVFFGLFTPLQGTPAIGAALGLLADDPQVEVTMIGAGQDRAETRRLAGRQPARCTGSTGSSRPSCPPWSPRHDVCLGIFGIGPKALRVVPNKVYQGAAAGCAVVTSDTPPQRQALGDAAVFVPPGDAGALAAALRALAARPRPRWPSCRAAAADRARDRFAPPVVVTALRDRLHAGVPGSR